jgi:hypothetical protein
LWGEIEPEHPGDIAVDPFGDLYVADFTGTRTTTGFVVSEYSSWGRTLLRTIPLQTGNQIVFGMETDGSGNLYVLMEGPPPDVVLVFAPGTSTTPSETLSNVGYPLGITVAANGTLYVPTENGATEQVDVAVYPPGTTTASYTIAVPYFQSRIAVDTQGNLYATTRNGALVYAPGSTTPMETISDGTEVTWNIILDSSNNLYFGNLDGSVSVVPAGSTSPTYSIPAPASGGPLVYMVADPFGNLCTVASSSGTNVLNYYQAGTGTLIGSRSLNASQIVFGHQAIKSNSLVHLGG